MTTQKTYQQLIENRLNSLLTFESAPENRLYEAARYAIFSGGKRLRPLLTLATVEACGGDLEKALSPACGLEMIHSYSLIHDDLPCMDDDDMRRGQPTVHKKFDEATALLAGDFLLTHAFHVLTSAPLISDIQKIKLIKVISERAGGSGMIGGQLLDLEAEKNSPDLSQLNLIHQMKTGALLLAAIEFGAILAELDEARFKTLQTFGQEVGLAFQIIDDVLDVTESVAKHGKLISSDTINGKVTYATLLGVDQAKAKALQLLEQALERISDFPYPETLISISRSLVDRNH